MTDDREIQGTTAETFPLFILLFLCFGTIILGVMTSFYFMQFKSTREVVSQQESNAVNLYKLEIETSLENIASDLLFISTQNELQDYLYTENPDSLVALEKEFIRLSQSKKTYDQIRYLDKTGQEVVRVNYNSGHSAAVASNNLQNKGKRYYFMDTFRLKPGEVFLSPMDLNIEHGEIEQPFKPTLRLGMPVFNQKKRKTGIVLINYLAEHTLNILKETQSISYGRPMLLNHQGYWLFHDDPTKEWGFMFEDRQDVSFANTFPQEWEKIQTQRTGQILTEKGIFTFSTICPLQRKFHTIKHVHHDDQNSNTELPSHRSWILVSYLSSELFNEQIAPLKLRVFSLTLVLFFLAALAAWGLALSITKRRIYQQHLISMSLHDALTLLPNRRLFLEKLKEGLSHAERYKTRLGLLYLDLDGFKAINDTYGHDYGDELLIEISKRMLTVTRKMDTFARLGGDEFAIILFQVNSHEGALSAGNKLIEEINKPIELKCGTVSVGASIGIVIYPDTSEDPEKLVKLADQTMYISKAKGKNVCTVSEEN